MSQIQQSSSDAPDCGENAVVINTDIIVQDAAPGKHHPRVKQTTMPSTSISPIQSDLIPADLPNRKQRPTRLIAQWHKIGDTLCCQWISVDHLSN